MSINQGYTNYQFILQSNIKDSKSKAKADNNIVS